MSQFTGQASQSGQYGGIRAKIEKVATQALRTAAQDSKSKSDASFKASKAQNSKQRGK